MRLRIESRERCGEVSEAGKVIPAELRARGHFMVTHPIVSPAAEGMSVLYCSLRTALQRPKHIAGMSPAPYRDLLGSILWLGSYGGDCFVGDSVFINVINGRVRKLIGR